MWVSTGETSLQILVVMSRHVDEVQSFHFFKNLSLLAGKIFLIMCRHVDEGARLSELLV